MIFHTQFIFQHPLSYVAPYHKNIFIPKQQQYILIPKTFWNSCSSILTTAAMNQFKKNNLHTQLTKQI